MWVEDRLEFSELQLRLASAAETRLRAHGRPATFMAFDLLCVGDQDVRSEPLRDRRAAIEGVLADAGRVMQLAPQTSDRSKAKSWMAEYLAGVAGLEGIVAKGADQPAPAGQARLAEDSRPGHSRADRRRDHRPPDRAGPTRPRPVRRHRTARDHRRDEQPAGQRATFHRLAVAAAQELASMAERSGCWPPAAAGRATGKPSREWTPRLVVEVAMKDAADPGGYSRHVAEFVRVRPDLTVEETEVLRVRRDGEGSAASLDWLPMSDRTLILFRHAKSDQSSPEADIDRPLNPRGRASGAGSRTMAGRQHRRDRPGGRLAREPRPHDVGARLGGARRATADADRRPHLRRVRCSASFATCPTKPAPSSSSATIPASRTWHRSSRTRQCRCPPRRSPSSSLTPHGRPRVTPGRPCGQRDGHRPDRLVALYTRHDGLDHGRD